MVLATLLISIPLFMTNLMNPIKAYRLKHKIPGRILAKQIKCDISYIYHLESGRARPSYEYAKAISRATNGEISVIELLEIKAA